MSSKLKQHQHTNSNRISTNSLVGSQGKWEQMGKNSTINTEEKKNFIQQEAAQKANDLVELAKQNAQKTIFPGACQKCGYLGHLPYQCLNSVQLQKQQESLQQMELRDIENQQTTIYMKQISDQQKQIHKKQKKKEKKSKKDGKKKKKSDKKQKKQKSKKEKKRKQSSSSSSSDNSDSDSESDNNNQQDSESSIDISSDSDSDFKKRRKSPTKKISKHKKR